MTRSTLLIVPMLVLCLFHVVAAQPAGPPADSPAGTEAAAAIAADPARNDVSSLIESIQFESLFTANTWWDWVTLLAAIFVGLVLGRIASIVLRRVGDKLETRGWPVRSHFFSDLANPASLLLLTLGLSFGLAPLQLSDTLRHFSNKTLLLLYCIAVFWYLFNLVAVIELAIGRLTTYTGAALDTQIAPLIRKALRIFLLVLATLFVVDAVFEKDIAAWLAGLGIAGLAISLASQDSLKNLFGSLTIFFDKTYAIGDFIKFSGQEGTVFDVGFRSTKIRTLDGHVVTIPNLNIVGGAVENVTRRPFIRRVLNLTITYDTPVDKIPLAIQLVKNILEEPGIAEPIHNSFDGDPLPPRVFFNDLNADSLNIRVMYWHMPPDYWQYTDHLSRVNLRIMEEFERAGIDFAFPTQTLHLAGDPKRKLVVETAPGEPPRG